MSKEKQIIEIKECIDAVYGADCAYFDVDGFAIAEEIYNAGYRKQNAGEWRVDDFTGIIKCNLCDNDAPISTVSGEQYEPEYCPNCGAKMKGGK